MYEFIQTPTGWIVSWGVPTDAPKPAAPTAEDPAPVTPAAADPKADLIPVIAG